MLARAEPGLRVGRSARRERTARARRRTADKPALVSAGWLYVLPAVVLFGFFVAYPVINTIYLSFYDLDGISGYQTFIGVDNYREMLGGLDPYFWLGVRNTVLWTVVTVPLQLLLGLALALVLDNAVRGRTIYRAAFFMPAVLSVAVISFAWSWIYSPQDGGATRLIQALGGTGQTWLADTSTAIWAAIGVSAWRYSGLIMLFYLAAMQMVPKELYEAAAIDGAGWWRRVTNVTLPQLLPTTVLLVLFGVIGALREFEVIYLLTRGGPAHATDLMSLQIFDQAFNQSRPGYGATISTALLLFTAVLAIPLLGLIGSAMRRRG